MDVDWGSGALNAKVIRNVINLCRREYAVPERSEGINSEEAILSIKLLCSATFGCLLHIVDGLSGYM